MADDVKAHQPEPHLVLGTSVRHKTAGYQGKIDGTTAIKGCFTSRGAPLLRSDEQFQYRIAVAGEAMRRIAPAEHLEFLKRNWPSQCRLRSKNRIERCQSKRNAGRSGIFD